MHTTASIDSDREADRRSPTPDLRAPGALRSDTYLVLQTRHSQRLVYGRSMEDGKQHIVGLIQFAALSRSIWNGACSDDPFAHWWLVQMHDAIEESTSELKALSAHVNQQLLAIAGVSVGLAQSIEPIRVQLTFTNPYGFRGAYLLAHFDDLVRAILTGRHVALIDRDTSERLLLEGGRRVRRAYNSALRYRFLGINADDIRLMTARGKQAETAMGAVPPEVIDGRLRAPHAPDPRARSFAMPFGLRRRATPTTPAEPGLADSPTPNEAAAPSDGASHAPVS